MGDVLDPKPPQWQRKQALEDVPEDRVLILASKLKSELTEIIAGEVDSTLVQLAALRLVLKAVVGNYRIIMGHAAAKELMRQASEMAEQYQVNGIDEPTE
jgi:hypothetical protein